MFFPCLKDFETMFQENIMRRVFDEANVSFFIFFAN